MVFRIKAQLRFASVADRTAAQTTIASAISGRNSTVLHSVAFTKGGAPCLFWEGSETDTGDAGTIYALIQAMTSPLAGSEALHHTCLHGDSLSSCLATAQKVWP